MRGERQLLRLGEYLVGRACQRLPQDVREERYREWAAELPVILHDPQARLAAGRAVRMLGYAADTVRGSTLAHVGAGRRTARMDSALKLLVAAGLVSVGWDIWTVIRAPGHGLSYVQLSWGLLLLAFPISVLVRSAVRVTVLIATGGVLAGLAVNLWDAARAPGDWVNYLAVTYFLILLLALWLARRPALGRHAGSPGSRRVAD